jgi:hypothetical protein
MTPDLLLAFLGLGAIGLVCGAQGEEPKSGRATAMLALAGLSAGVAGSAKVSGLLLLVALAIALAKSAHGKSPLAWVGVVLGALVNVPTLRYEAMNGWPMIRHRASGLGLSWKGIGAITGGQLLYLSPVLSVIAVMLLVDLWRKRSQDEASRALFFFAFVPLMVLVPLCIFHRGAEPHWIAPALLPLPLWAAKRAPDAVRFLRSRIVISGAVLAAVLVAFVHFWTLYPRSPSLAPKSYDPKVDITNELFGWPAITHTLGELGAAEEDTVLVGPHWVICAQLQLLVPNASVGCVGEPADFETWNPRSSWEKSERLLFVTDARFPTDPERLFPEYNLGVVQHVSTLRGGRVVRTFTMTLLERRAHALNDQR